MSDIECPRCHRISFEWEHHTSCVECHWTIRPTPVEQPYGFDVLIEVHAANSHCLTTDVRHYKGNETTARRRARSAPRFVRVLAVVPLSEATWINAYGEGRM